jgi:cytochrome P450
MWTLLLLDQHPHVARDLHDELCGHLQGNPPTIDRIGALPLLDRVVKESMRVLPPVPQQFRRATEDTTLGGVAVRRRSYVLLSQFMTNRNPDLYPDADMFKPERWEGIAPSAYEYATFSAGPRACIGYWFGLAMLKTAIASIVTRRRVALAPGTRIDYKLRVVFSPRRPVQAMFHRQDGAFTAAPIKGTIRNLVQLPN